MTRGHLPIPGNKRTPLLDSKTGASADWPDRRQNKPEPNFTGNGFCLTEYGLDRTDIIAIGQIRNMQRDIVLKRLGHHPSNKIHQPQVLRRLVILPQHIEILCKIYPLLPRPVRPILVKILGRICIDAKDRLIRQCRTKRQNMGHDKPAYATFGKPDNDRRKFSDVVAHDNELRADLQRVPRVFLLRFSQSIQGTFNMPQTASSADSFEKLRGSRVHGKKDSVQPGRNERRTASRVDQMAVGLKAYPALGRHQALARSNEFFEQRMQQRFAYAIEDQGLKVLKSWRQRLERFWKHVAVN